MNIYVCQMKVEPGNPEENLKTIERFVKEAENANADLAIFPELCLSGYLIGDLWEESSFVAHCIACGERVKELSQKVDILFGNVASEDETGENGRPILYNAAFYASNGTFKTLIDFSARNGKRVQKKFLPKTLLPSYREFDEPRYFSDARKLAQRYGVPIVRVLKPFKTKWNLSLGITICEDGWDSLYKIKPFEILNPLLRPGDILINISCSPYTQGKENARNRVFKKHAENAKAPLIYVNSVGTQNNGKNIYAFEGDSSIYNAHGEVAFHFPLFKEKGVLINIEENSITTSAEQELHLTGIAEVKTALVYMIKENLKRFHIERVVIGASGGIDSAVSAALYAEALGSKNVFLVNMPTRFNSATTQNAAKDLAQNLNAPYMVAPISEALNALTASLEKCKFERNETPMLVEGIHFENLQARMRSASFLATIASVVNAGFTCNGNKSEVMVGYCTLYGDTSGVMCALGDLWKTQVYELAAEINKEREIIPRASIEIPASAELSDAQNVDEGKGDPIIYPYHDKLFSYWVERWNRNALEDSLALLKQGLSIYCQELGVDETFVKSKFKDEDEIAKDMAYWFKRYKGIALAKRIQMPPILSVSRRAFGFDYRESQL